MKDWQIGLVASGLLLAVGLFVLGCDQQRQEDERHERAERNEWEGPCHDQSTLLATTTGSPDREKCPNRLHRMRVQVASAPSHEEFGALVFCECLHDGEADAGAER